MPHYSTERKQAILKKLLPPQNASVAKVSREEGISEQTLYNWRNEAKAKGFPVPGPVKTSTEWSSEAKLAVIIETASLSEIEVGEYCRKKGLYPEQIKAWKQEFIDSQAASPSKKSTQARQSKKDRQRIRQLEKELKRKEKALAEAAALLVLRKKLNAFYEDDNGDE